MIFLSLPLATSLQFIIHLIHVILFLTLSTPYFQLIFTLVIFMHLPLPTSLHLLLAYLSSAPPSLLTLIPSSLYTLSIYKYISTAPPTSSIFWQLYTFLSPPPTCFSSYNPFYLTTFICKFFFLRHFTTYLRISPQLLPSLLASYLYTYCPLPSPLNLLLT